MSQYDVAHGFYAKWILPVILAIIGVILVFVFLPSTAFVKDNKGNIYYSIGNEEYIGIEDKCYYDVTKNGSVYVKTDKVYDKNIPDYVEWVVNLSGIGSATGIGLIGVGGVFIVVNIVKEIVTASKRVPDDEDEED